MQLATLKYTKNTTKLLELAYNYAQPNGGNNGQITGITDSTGTQEAGRSVSYTYDEWSRLKTALTQGSTSYPQWGLSWTYDRYGNRKNQNVTAGSAPAPQLTISETTNRITSAGYVYDASGNLTKDDLQCYVFDAENRVVNVKDLSCTTTSATYNYDGAGLRVKKTTGGTTTVYIFSGSKVIAEYVGGPLSKEYIYAGSQLVASLTSSGTPTYVHPDQLSARVFTDSTGAKVGERGHLPFGEVRYDTLAADKWKFTTYERDSESGLDYAMFRFDSPRLGRFMTPDPICGNKTIPQALNRYAYVRNDPVNLIDPLGLCWCAWYLTIVTFETFNGQRTGQILDVSTTCIEWVGCGGGGVGGGNPGGRTVPGTQQTRKASGQQTGQKPCPPPDVDCETRQEYTDCMKERADFFLGCLVAGLGVDLALSIAIPPAAPIIAPVGGALTLFGCPLKRYIDKSRCEGKREACYEEKGREAPRGDCPRE